MADKRKSENDKDAKPVPAGSVQVGGNMDNSLVVTGSGNTINFISKLDDATKEEPDFWYIPHPYPMPPNFTGRATELKLLSDWLADNTNRLFILCALGRFGKSALAWQWINTRVNPAEWPKLVWWSFYQGDASFEHFIEETLKYLKLEVPQAKRAQVNALLKAMQEQKILLIMDGFERVLRAYSSMNAAYQGDEEAKRDDNSRGCVNIEAETFLKNICALPGMDGKILMTTRLTPSAVELRGQCIQGCHEEELKAMHKDDAVAFFHAQGINGTHAEIETACEPYGYHPLSLSILAGLIVDDRAKPGDIAVASRLDITEDVVANKHHVLEVAYDTLSKGQQKLLSTIACFRMAMDYEALQAVANETIDDDLKILEKRGLLHWNRKENKYDLHPIVRRYAYDRLTATDRTDAHARLVDYFEAVPTPQKVSALEDLAPVIELYHHTVRAGKLDEACDLIYDRINKPTYYQFGAYQLRIELFRALFPDGEDRPPRLKKESDQAWTLNGLANSYSLSGQPRRAVPLFELHNAIYEKAGNKENLAIGLGNVADDQLKIGALSEAERNLRRKIILCQETDYGLQEGMSHHQLSIVFNYRGIWQDAEQEQDIAQQMFEKENHVQGQGMVWSYRALRFLLMGREAVISNQSAVDSVKSAIQCAKRALELANEQAKDFPVPRDYVRAHWLLGAAYRANNELTLAEENLSKANNLCRQINSVDAEADILLDLARLSFAQNDFKDAQEKASEALVITERSGYVLQGADVHLFMAELALAGITNEKLGIGEDGKMVARRHAEEALKLARCEGGEYMYKVAFEEAERMLEKLK